MAGYDDAVDQLMAAPLAQFTARRQTLAKALREGGDREAAARLLEIRKPSAVVGAANQVARYDPEAMEVLLRAAHALEVAQSAALAGKGKGAADLRSASASFQQALDRVVLRARRMPGGRAGIEASRRLRDLLQAAALGGDETRAALARGRLMAEPPPIGFGGLDGGTVVSSPGPRANAAQSAVQRPSRTDLAAAARLAERVAAARMKVSRAEAAASQAEDKAARLEAQADIAEEDARRLRREATAARRRADERRQQAQRAQTELDQL
jgi:hypothetical protein